VRGGRRIVHGCSIRNGRGYGKLEIEFEALNNVLEEFQFVFEKLQIVFQQLKFVLERFENVLEEFEFVFG
jgi:hypothetical protein